MAEPLKAMHDGPILLPIALRVQLKRTPLDKGLFIALKTGGDER
ncbi:hypothetical protein [Paenibacillus mendelii]|uniref:Uncharacterized protein n=1 Tax=Paenibacillus mendelii TaxID=206163 RepID=A0ABV6JCY7_9BACL|nr:hypothetical protein [Paenibacillus mendelii]MCQ6562484.1 hypothetical protein [Paenibacillus mendelii]